MLPPPFPFLPTSSAWSAWGFDRPHIDCVPPEDGDEVLRQFLLYAQARSRGRPWRIQAEFDDAQRFRARNLLVEFDVHRDCELLPRAALMNIEYVIAVTTERDPVYVGSEGYGLYWLELPGIAAFCSTMAEALRAIDAVVPFVPATIRHFIDGRDRLALEVHLWQCISLGGDKVREAAVRRKMGMLGN
jgi:hypothetical protein